MRDPEGYVVFRLTIVELLMVALAIGSFVKGRTLFPFSMERSARPFGYWTVQLLVTIIGGVLICYGIAVSLSRPH